MSDSHKDAQVEKIVKAQSTPVLFWVITVLITGFGTMIVKRIESTSDKIDALIIKTIENGKDIEALKASDNRHDQQLVDFRKEYGRHEDSYQITPPKRRQ
jgi:hypothetical protein